LTIVFIEGRVLKMNRNKLAMLFLSLAVLLTAGTLMAEDVLTLQDGTVIKGTLVSRDAQTIRFKTKYAEGAYPVNAVKNLTMGGFGTPAPAAPVVAPAASVAAKNLLKAGSIISVKLTQALSSKMRPGSQFSAVLAAPLSAGGKVVAAGTQVMGSVTSSSVGRSCHIALTVNKIIVLGQPVVLQSQGVRFSGSAQPGAVRTTGRAAAVGGLFNGRSGARDGAKIGGAVAILRGPKVTQVPAGKTFNATILRDVIIP